MPKNALLIFTVEETCWLSKVCRGGCWAVGPACSSSYSNDSTCRKGTGNVANIPKTTIFNWHKYYPWLSPSSPVYWPGIDVITIIFFLHDGSIQWSTFTATSSRAYIYDPGLGTPEGTFFLHIALNLELWIYKYNDFWYNVILSKTSVPDVDRMFIISESHSTSLLKHICRQPQ